MEVTRTKIKLFDGVTSMAGGRESLETAVNEWIAENSEIKIKEVSASSSQNADESHKTIVTILYRATEEIETAEEKKGREELEESMPEIKKTIEETAKKVMAEVMAEYEVTPK